MKRFLILVAVTVGIANGTAAPPEPAEWDSILIRGGLVMDGMGSEPEHLDVRVVGDRILEVGPGLAAAPGERIIEAADRVVAPGFIDMHSHADRGIVDYPEMESQIRQGITTAIAGQDGASSIPVDELFARVERHRPTINFATMVGHGSVRSAVLGSEFARAARLEELATMAALVERGMRDGALGLSTGLEYDPGFFAETDEVVELARVAAAHGGYYASHVRDEENGVLGAWAEAIEIGRRAGIRVHISHAKLASQPVWGRAEEALNLLQKANDEGIRVTADWYPYTYWHSSLYVIVPGRDWDNRDNWEAGLAEIGGPGNVLVTDYPYDPAQNGRTIEEIARDWGTDAVSTIKQMIANSGPSIGIIGTAMIEEDLEQLFSHPLVVISSDGEVDGAHPRGHGAFPRVLATYVRERNLVSMSEAIAKMTGRSAEIAGLADRGRIAARYMADIIVFDPAAIQDQATKTEPKQHSVGVEYVLVNGEIVLDGGTLTGARPGRALRRAQ